MPRSRYFYPRPPRGGRLTVTGRLLYIWLFLSTSSARRTTHQRCIQRSRRDISIHVLREEDDVSLKAFEVSDASISIHVLREEDDPSQPAGPAEGVYFYPRPPRGGRPPMLRNHRSNLVFLSTSSARRTTTDFPADFELPRAFLSTSSARRTTVFAMRDTLKQLDFYPRPPRGGRRYAQTVPL